MDAPLFVLAVQGEPDRLAAVRRTPYRHCMPNIFTIGYEHATVAGFQDALSDAKINLLVDIRAVASSRRPGFAKTALAANSNVVGAEYLHLRALGTPADGRAEARAGRPEEMKMTTDPP